MTFTLTTHCNFQAEAEWSSVSRMSYPKKPAIPTTKMVCIMSLHIPLGVVLLPEFTHPVEGGVAT